MSSLRRQIGYAPTWHIGYATGRPSPGTCLPGARPYVILQPFGPVLFVYDLSDTEPRSEEKEESPKQELPKKVTDPFAVEGTLGEDTWTRMLRHCREKEKVAVRQSENLHRRHGGRIERMSVRARSKNPGDCLYRVLLNKNLGIEEQYGALAHELGHLFCGHLGTDGGAWWDECRGADKPRKEIETESVAYLACRRAGLHSLLERYLHWHVERANDSPGTGGSSEGPLLPVRLRAVLDVAGYVESMGEKEFKSKRDEESKRGGDG